MAKNEPKTRFRAVAAALLTAGALLCAPGAPAAEPQWKPLPWAADPAEAKQGGLTVRADKQLVGEYRELTGFRFSVENTSDQPLTVKVKALEVLSARSGWPPPRPGEKTHRHPTTRKLTIRGCWFEDATRKITVVRDKGRGPVNLKVPPKTTLQVMLRFKPIRQGGLSNWRRLTFSAGGPPLRVTGPIVPFGFIPGTIQGELR